MTTNSDLVREIALSLDDKTLADAFVQAEISTSIAFQIRAMRKRLGWTQKQLADETGQHQKTISEFEDPNYGNLSVTSLLRLAAAFDVGLVVRFAPFSDLVTFAANLSAKDHAVPERTKDTRLQRQKRVRRPLTGTTASDLERAETMGRLLQFRAASTTSRCATKADTTTRRHTWDDGTSAPIATKEAAG